MKRAAKDLKAANSPQQLRSSIVDLIAMRKHAGLHCRSEVRTPVEPTGLTDFVGADPKTWSLSHGTLDGDFSCVCMCVHNSSMLIDHATIAGTHLYLL